jgi:outer membrane protein OmpA-like peptidoglycan-associated protein
MLRKFFTAAAAVALVAGTSTACASKGFVRSNVGEVNDKVESLGRSVEETQERTRQNASRITEVDQKADQAAQSAQQANTAAARASDAASAADAKAEAVEEAFEKASRRLVFEVVLSEDQGNFRFGATELPDEAKAALDGLIDRLKAEPQAAWFEIEGHTDSTGPAATNERLGLERAESVKRYLYEQHQIPLHKMNVISYGEDKPVAPNGTRDGRAQNRRVVVKVLT